MQAELCQATLARVIKGVAPMATLKCLLLCSQAYNIHVNGVLHCRVRYSQLLGLHEQVGLALLP